MAVTSSLALKAEGTDEARTMSVDLAARRLRVTGAGEALDAIDFGLLQTAPKWASVTGRLGDSTRGAELGFVLIVDESAKTATLEVDGRPAREYRLK